MGRHPSYFVLIALIRKRADTLFYRIYNLVLLTTLVCKSDTLSRGFIPVAAYDFVLCLRWGCDRADTLASLRCALGHSSPCAIHNHGLRAGLKRATFSSLVFWRTRSRHFLTRSCTISQHQSTIWPPPASVFNIGRSVVLVLSRHLSLSLWSG